MVSMLQRRERRGKKREEKYHLGCGQRFLFGSGGQASSLVPSNSVLREKNKFSIPSCPLLPLLSLLFVSCLTRISGQAIPHSDLVSLDLRFLSLAPSVECDLFGLLPSFHCQIHPSTCLVNATERGRRRGGEERGERGRKRGILVRKVDAEILVVFEDGSQKLGLSAALDQIIKLRGLSKY